MADRVRHVMEKMVPELEDLQNRRLCTLREIKALARRREHFEYLMAGRAPTREDFLLYLQLEINLEALLKVRSDSVHTTMLNAAIVAIRKRVHYIFDRACRRFMQRPIASPCKTATARDTVSQSASKLARRVIINIGGPV